jgi:DnaJ family protein C protein 3
MKNHKKAEPYCTEALSINPDSLAGLLAQAHRQMDAEEYEAALSTLKDASEKHPGQQSIQSLHSEAQVLLKRSKQKDYYKVLGVSHDADARTIKHSYRKMTKQFHPDKSHKLAISKDEAEKKMASINEAYEVLSNPELKARFDAGDDPNSQEQQGQPFQGSPFAQGANGQQFFFRSGGAGSGGQQNFKFQQGFQFPGGFQFP